MTQDYGADAARSRQVLVYLHGHGSAPSEVHPFFRQRHDDGRLRICPQATIPTEGGWSWFRSGSRGADGTDLRSSLTAIRRLVEGTLAELGLDWSDVVLAGFSQGAATALALAAELSAETGPAHERPLGGLLLQAGFVPEVLDDEIEIGRIHSNSVLVQHGDGDEVVPVDCATDLGALIGSSGSAPGRVEVEILPGGHTLTTAMLDGARRWLDELAVRS